MKLHVLGIDLGKTVFHLVGLDSTGKVVNAQRASSEKSLIQECGWKDGDRGGSA